MPGNVGSAWLSVCPGVSLRLVNTRGISPKLLARPQRPVQRLIPLFSASVLGSGMFSGSWPRLLPCVSLQRGAPRLRKLSPVSGIGLCRGPYTYGDRRLQPQSLGTHLHSHLLSVPMGRAAQSRHCTEPHPAPWEGSASWSRRCLLQATRSLPEISPPGVFQGVGGGQTE